MRMLFAVVLTLVRVQCLLWPDVSLRIRRWTRVDKYDPSNFLFVGPSAAQFVRVCGVGLVVMGGLVMWRTVASLP